MSLDPSPLASQPTPLLSPTDPVPSRGSALIGALIAVVVAVVVVVVSLRFGSPLLFIPAGLKTQAIAVPATSPYHIQGFDLYWRKGLVPPAGTTGGYDQMAPLTTIAQREAQDYHMNLAVITVTLDQFKRDTGKATPDGNIQVQTNGPDTYSDEVYVAAIKAVRAAGLTPAIKIELRVTKPGNDGDTWPGKIGDGWALSSTGSGAKAGVLAKEQYWFDTYSDAAVKYATLAQANNVPFFIIGSNLQQLSSDTSETTKLTDTNKNGDGNVKPWPGDTGITCNGRRECGWRHIINAVQGKQYAHTDGKPIAGASYRGHLIYAASVRASVGNLYEWEAINWWDAVDLIGIDAYFPLLDGAAATSADQIAAAWNGQGLHVNQNAAGSTGLVKRIEAAAQKYHRPVLFTSVGYSSFKNANNEPPGKAPDNPAISQEEQRFDMEGLLLAFSAEPWWVGVIWSADYPFSPRSKVSEIFSLDFQPWLYNTQWGGDCLATETCTHPEKQAGTMLRSYYQIRPIPANA